jgi:hypothetical protein
MNPSRFAVSIGGIAVARWELWPDDVLQADRCLRCDYILASHRLEGLCPECGLAYDADSVQLDLGRGLRLIYRLMRWVWPAHLLNLFLFANMASPSRPILLIGVAGSLVGLALALRMFLDENKGHYVIVGPAGLCWHVPGQKEVSICWSEIEDVYRPALRRGLRIRVRGRRRGLAVPIGGDGFRVNHAKAVIERRWKLCETAQRGLCNP